MLTTTLRKVPDLQVTIRNLNSNWPNKLEVLSEAAAYVHQSARAALHAIYDQQTSLARCHSPLLYLEFLHMFRLLCCLIASNEQVPFAHSFLRHFARAVRILSSSVERLCELSARAKVVGCFFERVPRLRSR